YTTKDKRVNKSIITKNIEIYRCTDIHEWYERYVVEPILTSLEEHLSLISRVILTCLTTALLQIHNLIVNVNKLNPMHAGCHIESPRAIMLEKAVINVKSMDNACFAWSVIAALYPAERNTERESSYPHYIMVLNLAGIEFPMTLKDISRFEHLIVMSINVYGIENEQVLPLRLNGDEKEKHVNMLYLQDPRKDGVAHFAWIMNLSRLVRTQLTRKEHRKYFCDRSNEKLKTHEVDCLKMNDCCIRLPSASEKWLEFSKHPNQERVPFIVYADLESYHTDLSFCPMRDKPPGKRENNLLATLYDKQRYVIHYRNLQQCTRHGLRLTKLYKLMNNAVFGKTTENVRNHVDVKLLTKWDGAEAMIAKPNFHSRSVFAENLIAVEMRKLEVKFDKPIYVGMCILDISKVCLYEFHYGYMSSMFQDKCKILYTDTDSLIYRVECEDVYETMKRDVARFDMSDYPADNAYSMPLANKKVPGLMKDENNGALMTEFIGLRAKMYAVRVDGKKDTKKVKGVKSNVVARSITFDNYTRCLNEEIEMTRRQSRIRSKLHEVYTIPESKIALSPYDDKRYVVPDSTETLPWGHWRIPL
ncbi:hypothetical protein ALC57_06399, partial [Trachymyrmex cornetzi]